MPIVGTGLTLPGIRSEFFNRFDAVPKYFTDLATRIESKTDTEKHRWMGNIAGMREWGTGRKAVGVFKEAYDVENMKYEITLEIDRDEIDDDQTGQIRIRIGQMAERAAQHKDACINDLLVNGASSGYEAYDGSLFFAADHESGKSGAQDNTMAPTAVDADNPTTAEFRTALGAGIARLLGFVDDQAEPMSLDASGLVCIVPPTMLITALEAINATLIGSTTNVLQGAARVIAFPRLTNASMWYLLKTNVAVRPFIFQDRMPIELNALERESEEGFKREKFLYGVRARYRITYGYWQYALSLDFTE
jgi:phage major head subunit gpT-like protein